MPVIDRTISEQVDDSASNQRLLSPQENFVTIPITEGLVLASKGPKGVGPFFVKGQLPSDPSHPSFAQPLSDLQAREQFMGSASRNAQSGPSQSNGQLNS